MRAEEHLWQQDQLSAQRVAGEEGGLAGGV